MRQVMASASDALTLSESAAESPKPLSVDTVSERLTQRSILVLMILLTVVIGLGDVTTGVEVPFTILYMLPIAVGAWYLGRHYGALLSVLATGSLAFSLVRDRMSSLGVAGNVGGAAALFITASWGVARLRVYVDRERAQRRMAVDQLRHAERLNVIGTLAAGVAHELGTPLNVIAGCAELLAEDSVDDQVQRRSAMIIEQVARASSIIRHLLDFGHRGSVARTRIDLNDIAASASEMLQSTARKRNCTVEFELGPPILVSGNAAELEQVLSNLILNGIHAMDRGAVYVRVSSELRANQRVGCVEVEDQGSGIPAENVSQIFDPFFTTKGVGEGTGLGLSVSYGIVRDHDGMIEVASAPSRGSRFTVVLPVRD